LTPPTRFSAGSPAKWPSVCAASTSPSTRRVTGAKSLDKVYYRHSGYPGGITATNFRDMQAKHPGRALEKAVKGMLPKGPLGYAMIKKLKVYGGAEHPHTAQQPKVLDI
jgi:large subunit ribosomal protein L13